MAGKVKILYVEDDKVLADSLVIFINELAQDTGYAFEIHHAKNLRWAISAVPTFQPDLIITDGRYPRSAEDKRIIPAWKELVGFLKLTRRDIPTIILSGDEIKLESIHDAKVGAINPVRATILKVSAVEELMPAIEKLADEIQKARG